MYGLSDDVNLSFLVGRELQQICVGLYQVQLNFDENTWVHMESALRVTTPTGEEILIEDLRHAVCEGRAGHDSRSKTDYESYQPGDDKHYLVV